MHGGSSSPAADPGEDIGHGCAGAAREAHDEAHRPVDLDDPVGIAPRRLVEAVDVLGDQGVEHAASFEVDQGLVAGVGPGRPGR